jgi:hypothetical protein
MPRNAMGRAIDYTLTMWPMLTAYLEDGRIEINNNPVENDFRPTAIDKKNWLFIGEAEAGQRSAQRHRVHDHRSLSQPRHRPAELSARCPHQAADAH